jgi:hypothetical protein
MGMFDNIRVKKQLPLDEDLGKLDTDWGKELFQTKDLDNALDLYEISEEGRLRHLRQSREWKADPTAPLGGFYEVVSEVWEEVPFHGVVRFYTSHCDSPELDYDFINHHEQMSWEDIMETEGYDWWIEFEAVFNHGHVGEIKLSKTEKSLIRKRLAGNKEWAQRHQLEESRLFNRCVRKLRKIPGYRGLTRNLSRLEQKFHEKISSCLRKIS